MTMTAGFNDDSWLWLTLLGHSVYALVWSIQSGVLAYRLLQSEKTTLYVELKSDLVNVMWW